MNEFIGWVFVFAFAVFAVQVGIGVLVPSTISIVTAYLVISFCAFRDVLNIRRNKKNYEKAN